MHYRHYHCSLSLLSLSHYLDLGDAGATYLRPSRPRSWRIPVLESVLYSAATHRSLSSSSLPRRVVAPPQSPSSSSSTIIMGCLNSKAGNKDDAVANKKIENQLKKDRKDLEHEVKLLLLGTQSSPLALALSLA